MPTFAAVKHDQYDPKFASSTPRLGRPKLQTVAGVLAHMNIGDGRSTSLFVHADRLNEPHYRVELSFEPAGQLFLERALRRRPDAPLRRRRGPLRREGEFLNCRPGTTRARPATAAAAPRRRRSPRTRRTTTRDGSSAASRPASSRCWPAASGPWPRRSEGGRRRAEASARVEPRARAGRREGAPAASARALPFPSPD